MPFPPSKSSSVLDQPPPSPALGGMGQPGGGGSATPGPGLGGPPADGAPSAPGSMGAMGAAIPVGAGSLPPEILTGVMSVGQQLQQTIDGLAQVTPELGADWQALKQLLQQTLAKLLVSGGLPSTPTNTGASAFPGGGIDRGSLPTSPPLS